MKKHKSTLPILTLLFLSSLAAEARSPGEIVFIGDSQATGSFGTTLHQLMQHNLSPNGQPAPYTVHSTFECASNPATWTRTGDRWKEGVPNFCGLMTIEAQGKPQVHNKNTGEILPSFQSVMDKASQSLGPKVVVIEQGSNMLRNDAPMPSKFPGFSALMQEIKAKGFHCVWIGPPHPGSKANENIQFDAVAANEKHGPMPGRNEQLKALVKSNGCEYIDSSPLADRSAIPASDMHCTGNCGVKWAHEVFNGTKNPTKLQELLLKWSGNSTLAYDPKVFMTNPGAVIESRNAPKQQRSGGAPQDRDSSHHREGNAF